MPASAFGVAHQPARRSHHSAQAGRGESGSGRQPGGKSRREPRGEACRQPKSGCEPSRQPGGEPEPGWANRRSASGRRGA
jgi:hypothetical protein